VVLVVVGALLLTEAAVTVACKEPITAFMAARNQDKAASALRDLESAEVRQRRRVLATRRAVRAFIGERALALNTRIGRGQPVGRLKIDRLDLNYVVVQGTDENSLTKGPAHYKETPLPGTPGKWTVGIAGHRTTYLAPFRHLDDMKRGDRIVFTLPYARFSYRVQGTKIVDDQELGVMRPQGYNRLALTACHPLYSDAQRIVVFARLKKMTPRGAAARWSRKLRGRA
jgi:sortase A